MNRCSRSAPRTQARSVDKGLRSLRQDSRLGPFHEGAPSRSRSRSQRYPPAHRSQDGESQFRSRSPRSHRAAAGVRVPTLPSQVREQGRSILNPSGAVVDRSTRASQHLRSLARRGRLAKSWRCGGMGDGWLRCAVLGDHAEDDVVRTASTRCSAAQRRRTFGSRCMTGLRIHRPATTSPARSRSTSTSSSWVTAALNGPITNT